MPAYRCDTLKGSRAGALAGCLTAPGASPLIDWQGIIPCAAEAFVSRTTPTEIVDKLNTVVNAALSDPG